MSLEARKVDIKARFDELLKRIDEAKNPGDMVGYNIDVVKLINECAELRHDYEMAKTISEIKEKSLFSDLCEASQKSTGKEREASVHKNEEYQKQLLKHTEADASCAEIYRLCATMERVSDMLMKIIEKTDLNHKPKDRDF